ncbi:FMN-dependent NADH-azoreductase [Thiohalobacter thiocyanaticus]|uniref:FMN dependent NADH:quinone oxidoreductase n=1 Tax=Thiohalobacter thiocyanaticus TaxID=585455 RepID=A0A426QLW7_9GAMM|nr:NAD(P)H-dependent oxidoreductase [Thiohalobacter thiocyanaticus]RRQ22764.1 FMN-dependent NADH-azoreductase [Thiohalobacter thiocyanaticus]
MSQDSATSLNVLTITASARQSGSISRRLVAQTLAALRERHPGLRVQTRDLAAGLPLLGADWIEANFTPPAQRGAGQQRTLALSDTLVRELQAADLLVIGTPIYNFSIPAALKAWIDLVARAGVTFRYTENGPQGLLRGKQALILIASGGTPVGSEIDFASGYLRHVLGFLGIEDVTVIAADRIMQQQDEAVVAAEQGIAAAVETMRNAA